ncbi:TRAP transporter large permease [Natrinema versiforme]|uniref:TRAP transporter large permease n=1 Tax=Natrinema versiforme TaxID=88724 RepID=A0A4P8WMW2_9EURY|nr:TRAP transporter large permease [Natrinema versiforme]QCS44947.1 TRAP transporter large permease [Natrinema versiforme]
MITIPLLDPVVLAVLFLGILLVLYGIGTPIAIAMLATSIIMMALPTGINFNSVIINSRLFNGINSFGMLAFPFYVLLGRLMNTSGMTERLFDFASALVSQFRGGIVYVNILASIIFAGMSGLALADAAGLGRIEYAVMRDHGYDKDIAIGVTGSSSMIGPIIPPSVPIILYAILAEQSIGQLFLGGILPGLLLGLLLMVFVTVIIFKRGYERGDPFSLTQVMSTFKEAILAIFIPVLIIGGILGGYFTATEAGAIAVVYVTVLACVFGELNLGDFLDEARDSMVETFSLTFIIASATVYGLVALQLRLPMLLTDWVTSVSTDPTTVLFLICALLLVIGTFMSVTASITILTPLLIPVIETVGIDPIHFGIVMVFTLMIGVVTPPFGAILFVLEKVTDASLEEVIRSIIPYYIPMVLAVIILILFPELVTYIPNNIMG